MKIHIVTTGGTIEKVYSESSGQVENVAQKIVNHFRDRYFPIQVTRKGGYKLDDVYCRNEALSNTELMGMLEVTSKRLLIDSSMQHGACALGLPSTVLWQATSPIIFGHRMHDNITAKPKESEKLPGSLYFDYQFDQNDHEFPYEEEDLDNLYDIDRIIDSLETQGKNPS